MGIREDGSMNRYSAKLLFQFRVDDALEGASRSCEEGASSLPKNCNGAVVTLLLAMDSCRNGCLASRCSLCQDNGCASRAHFSDWYDKHLTPKRR
jgi:hypothetical protein